MHDTVCVMLPASSVIEANIMLAMVNEWASGSPFYWMTQLGEQWTILDGDWLKGSRAAKL